MKPLYCFAVIGFLFAGVAQGAPATAPTSAPTVESLMQGDLFFAAPDGWKLEGKAKTGRLVVFSHTEPTAKLVVNVDPQQTVLDDSAATKIGQMLLKQIRANADKGKLELTSPPKMEPDGRFFLRIHHRYKTEEQSGDQLQIYRIIGRNLVAVSTIATNATDDEAKAIFAEAEKTLLSVKTAKQQAAGATAVGGAAGGATSAKPVPKVHPATKPSVLPLAKISVHAPVGWAEELNDAASGVVATYHESAEPFNTLLISVRPLPKEAKADPKLRDALVDEIVNGEKTEFKFDDAQVVGETEILKDRRFLKKEKTRYEKADAKIAVTSRQIRIGDNVISIALASVDAQAAENDRLADEVALSLRAAGNGR